jgi:hypothetical protein
MKEEQAFAMYEYKEVNTNTNMASFIIDGYKSFGWILDENINPKVSNSKSNIILRLKRNRKILNKMELTRLQRNFEFCLKEIDKLERSKTSSATLYSLIIGIIGTVFMAGSVFAVTAKPPKIALCVILAIPAFAGWISPIFVYKYLNKKTCENADILIEEKQDEIFEICEKGSKLLY